jgi:hypothetical protein
MPTVRLSFSPAPAHVRTARLVGVAVARRAGVAEELLEEIRLAIGEACSRAVALHRSVGLTSLIDVTMADDDRFTVQVTDHATGGPATGGAGLDAASGAAASGAAASGAAGSGTTPGGSTAGGGVGSGLVTAGGASVTGPVGRRTAPEVFLAEPGLPLAATPDVLAEEAVVARMGLALLAGLVDDLEVALAPAGDGTEVRMSWPLERVKNDDEHE